MDCKTFENLPDEKKQAILSAGISLFGQHGYEKASIFDIAKASGISKPAVFYYFGTKENLFLYLVRYTNDSIKGIFQEGVEDFFETTASFFYAQLKLIKIYPGMFDFMNMVNEMAKTNEFEVFEKYFEESRALNESIVFNRVDWGKFRDEYDRTTIMNLVTWVIVSCLKQYKDEMPIDDIFTEIKRYLQILKTTLYKTEYL